MRIESDSVLNLKLGWERPILGNLLNHVFPNSEGPAQVRDYNSSDRLDILCFGGLVWLI